MRICSACGRHIRAEHPWALVARDSTRTVYNPVHLTCYWNRRGRERVAAPSSGSPDETPPDRSRDVSPAPTERQMAVPRLAAA